MPTPIQIARAVFKGSQQGNAIVDLANAVDTHMSNSLAHPEIWAAMTHDEDLRFPAQGINPPGATSDPTRNQDDGTLEFSASASNIIAFQVQIPHDWVPNTPLKFHVHWMPVNTDTGNVLWRFAHRIANIDAVMSVQQTADVLDAGAGVAETHQMTGMVALSTTGITPSAMLMCTLTRVGGDVTDTHTGVAKLLELDIHYTRYGYGFTSS